MGDVLAEFVKSQQENAQKQQTDFLLKLSEILQPTVQSTNEEFRMETLGNGISEFEYNEDEGSTFESWFNRYETLFSEDAKNISDEAKVRLLLRKLNTRCHQQYIDIILPKQAKEIKFEETVKILKGMFGRNISLFNLRYHCLKLVKSPAQDFTSYAAIVNKCCEDFKIKEMTDDQFKCLILDGETKSTISLQALTTDCQRITNLKIDTTLIEQQNTMSVNAVGFKKTPKASAFHQELIKFIFTHNSCTIKLSANKIITTKISQNTMLVLWSNAFFS